LSQVKFQTAIMAVELTISTFLLLSENKTHSGCQIYWILKALFYLTNIVGHFSPVHRHACRRTGEYSTLIHASAGEVTDDILQIK